MAEEAEKTTEATKDAAAASAEKPAEGKPTIREFVAKERAATEGASKTTKSDAEPAKEGESKEATDDKATEPKVYTPAEIDEELKTKDLRDLDPKRIPPELKSTLDKLQAAEGRKHKALNDKLALVDQKLKQLDETLAKAKDGKPEAKPAETEEDENLPLSKDEIRETLKSKAGKAAVAEILEELGYERIDAKEAAESRLVRDAIATAKSEDTRLQDEKFFDETLEVINADERLSKIAKKEKVSGAELTYVFLTAANNVARTRADKERGEIDKERAALVAEKDKLKKAAQEDKNRTTPVSKTVGTRQPIVPSGERPSYRDYVKGLRGT